MNDIIRIRKIDGAQILDTMNCAAISERFSTALAHGLFSVSTTTS